MTAPRRTYSRPEPLAPTLPATRPDPTGSIFPLAAGWTPRWSSGRAKDAVPVAILAIDDGEAIILDAENHLHAVALDFDLVILEPWTHPALQALLRATVQMAQP